MAMVRDAMLACDTCTWSTRVMKSCIVEIRDVYLLTELAAFLAVILWRARSNFVLNVGSAPIARAERQSRLVQSHRKRLRHASNLASRILVHRAIFEYFRVASM